MKSRVWLSGYSTALTVILSVVLVGACIFTMREKIAFCTILSILAIVVITSMIYAPVSICADPDYVTVRSVLRRHRIPVGGIESVSLFQPTMGAYRLWASGGYFGYWGLFREGDVGRYMAYYGKASDCFMILMKNGDKYVLGCENPGAMVEYINSLKK